MYWSLLRNGIIHHLFVPCLSTSIVSLKCHNTFTEFSFSSIDTVMIMCWCAKITKTHKYTHLAMRKSHYDDGTYKLRVMPSPDVSPTVDTMCGLPAWPNTIHIQQYRKTLYLSPSKLQSIRSAKTSFTVLSSPRLALKQSIASPCHIINLRSEFQALPRHNLLVCLAAEASPFIPVTAMFGRVVVGYIRFCH